MSNPAKFKVGDTAPGGFTIDHIYGQTDKVLVFRDKDHTVHHYIDADSLSPKDLEVVKLYHDLANRVFDILPRKHWKKFVSHLASAMFQGFTSADEATAKRAFQDIEARVVEYSKLFYLWAAVSTALALGTICFVLFHCYWVESHRIYALYLLFAFAGALASVMSRAGSIQIGAYEPQITLAFRGIFRITLGGLLACFFIAASKGNLLFGFVTSNHWSFLAFSFLSGFSERFVPALLTRVEAGKTPNSGKAARS